MCNDFLNTLYVSQCIVYTCVGVIETIERLL